ncbi:MAG TPA: cytoplasmic protein, partial [Desulfobacterales bacterium]|nr:cytoplasmic protein [Desulfobacterales bacterium]
FVEKYTGLVGFGLDRETDEYSITYYVQKFSDDELMKLLRSRMSNSDIQALADMLIRLLKTYLSNQEYHRYFLKDEDQEENT